MSAGRAAARKYLWESSTRTASSRRGRSVTSMRPVVTVPSTLRQLAGMLCKPHPQHVHRRAEIFNVHAGYRANRRVTAVGADDEVGAVISKVAVGDGCANAGRRRAVFDDQVGRLRLASASEMSDNARAFSARKFRKSHCGMSAMNLQCVGTCVEVGDLYGLVADRGADLRKLRMRQGRGNHRASRARRAAVSVDGWIVSPRKSRKKSAYFSSTVDVDARARQQKRRASCRRAAADDADSESSDARAGFMPTTKLTQFAGT